MRRMRARRRARLNRRRRRNLWPNDPAGHRKAAEKGWRRRKKGKKAKKRNPFRSRRRGRRRNAGWRIRYNRRRRGGRRMRYNRRRGGRRMRYNRRRNPSRVKGLSMRKPVHALMAGYDLKTLQSAATITVGALANNAIYKVVSGFIPVDLLKAGPGAIAGKIAMSGITGAAVGMVAPGLASEVFFGGVLQAVMDAFNSYVTPNIPGLRGLEDYLSVEDARRAQALGDYLSVEDTRRAQPLGANEGEAYIAEELAAIA